VSRLFEFRNRSGGDEVLALVDLDKVCLVRVEVQSGHHYQRVSVRFVDGHEAGDLVPPGAAQQFLDAFRAYVGGAG
jgi:hypothetical protein